MRETTAEPKGYFTLLLHAHLPYVRQPDHERFLEENWFYEAMTETYLPLLTILDGLVRDGVDFRLSMSLTPPLVSMLDDELLRDRYQRKLQALIDLCEKEIIRHRHHSAFLATARFYHDRFRRLMDYYLHECQRDVAGAFRRLQDRGTLEILASAATHGFLPLLRHEPASARAQVALGVEHYRKRFGREPQGFWLPECAYYPGLDELLAEAGVRYFILEAHGVLHGSTRATYGVHAPIVCPSGVAAFGRDPQCSKQVWSTEEGFPGHPDYREFYRDIGFELPVDYIGSYIGPDGIRVQTGIKYHRITGRTEAKEPYVRGWAMDRAAEHAGQFLRWRQEQARWVRGRMDRRPIILAPYDAELLGHWWFEGPEWMDFFFRKMALAPDDLLAVTPSEYLAEYPDAQLSVPCASSWGYKGFSEVWINGSNDWIYPRLHEASRDMARLAFKNRGARGLPRRALNQAARELLLAQASDWAFILKNNTASNYASLRVREHLKNFEDLAGQLEGAGGVAGVSQSLVEKLENQNCLFPELEFEVFEEKLPRGEWAIRENPEHVVFLTAEATPYVKVGGLGDVAGALPAALAKLGSRVTLVLPSYRCVDRIRHGLRKVKDGLSVTLGPETVPFSLLEAAGSVPGVRVLFVDLPRFFDRPGVYVDPDTGQEYKDTAERFISFTKASLEGLRALGEPVDIIHCHDHQTALAPAYLKITYRKDPILGLAASVYTLHNLGYQGAYADRVLDVAGFGRDQFHPGSPFEHHGKVNFMKLAVHFADKVSTVSEGYAREICSDEKLGAGLQEVLQARRNDLVGILNGIDVEEWNPATDPHLPRNYGPESLEGKRESKIELFRVSDLDPALLDKPLVGVISRLVDQKGFDLVHESLDQLLSLDITLVVLGTGLPKYEQFLQTVARRHADRVAVHLKFDNPLAHLIEAGADIFLMPSLYEPCGLNQMYSLRYGAVPVVRRTGGLADTVSDDDATPDGGVGFSFEPYTPVALVDAMKRAVRAFEDKERWIRIVRSGMARDNSWNSSGRRYVELYRAALASRG
jgi:1,4-alpha-glucan branching enzyme